MPAVASIVKPPLPKSLCARMPTSFLRACAAIISVAGGCAFFAGLSSPLGKSIALGLEGDLTSKELDLVERFYRDRGVSAQVDVCPLGSPLLLPLLLERGYRFGEWNNVLVRAIGEEPLQQTGQWGGQTRQAGPGDEREWATVITRGFMEDAVLREEDLHDLIPFSFLDSSVGLWAVRDGVPAGGAVLSVHGDVAMVLLRRDAPGDAAARRAVGPDRRAPLLGAAKWRAPSRGADLSGQRLAAQL